MPEETNWFERARMEASDRAASMGAKPAPAQKPVAEDWFEKAVAASSKMLGKDAGEKLQEKLEKAKPSWEGQKTPSLLDMANGGISLDQSPHAPGQSELDRQIKLKERGRKNVISSSPLDGNSGDMWYHNGTTVVKLTNPGTPTNYDFVMRHNGTAPYWEEPEICS